MSTSWTRKWVVSTTWFIESVMSVNWLYPNMTYSWINEILSFQFMLMATFQCTMKNILHLFTTRQTPGHTVSFKPGRTPKDRILGGQQQQYHMNMHREIHHTDNIPAAIGAPWIMQWTLLTNLFQCLMSTSFVICIMTTWLMTIGIKRA